MGGWRVPVADFVLAFKIASDDPIACSASSGHYFTPQVGSNLPYFNRRHRWINDLALTPHLVSGAVTGKIFTWLGHLRSRMS